MVSLMAAAITTFLHLVLGITFFMEPPPYVWFTTVPSVASWLFVIGFLDLLLDFSLIPLRYMHLPYVCQIIVETIGSIILTEFSSIIIWYNIEKISCTLCKSMLLAIGGLPPAIYYEWEDYILGILTTSISFMFLLSVLYATDHYFIVYKKIKLAYRKSGKHLKHLWQKSRRKLLWTKRNEGSNENVPAHLPNNCYPQMGNEYDQFTQTRKYETRSSKRNQSQNRYRRYR
ncbi:uncharacterized protein LOC142234219 [Haematobia irritans]|uniref:uncharacterized protein LOC142234219 n=1 Tax=Haematobia irritans TaxID=7368 RepID=UPI003F4FEC87